MTTMRARAHPRHLTLYMHRRCRRRQCFIGNRRPRLRKRGASSLPTDHRLHWFRWQRSRDQLVPWRHIISCQRLNWVCI